MKYTIAKGCQWSTFSTYGREGQTVDATDLKTADGRPLPKVVLDHFVGNGSLVEATEQQPTEPANG